MKKNVKIALMAGLALIVTGALIFGVSFMLAKGDWNRYSVSSRSVTRESYSVDASQVTALQIYEGDREVRIQPSSDGKLSVSYCDVDGESYEIELTDGVLSVKRDGDRALSGYVGVNIGKQADDALIISLPADFGGDVQLNSGSGDISLKGFEAGVLSLCLGSGKVQVENMQAAELSVTCASSDVFLENVTVQGTAFIACTSGAIDVSNCKAQSVEGYSTSGDIEISALDASAISLGSTNGDISGSVAGSRADYSISCHTTSGESNLQSYQTDAQRSLSVQSTSGSVDISFENDM